MTPVGVIEGFFGPQWNAIARKSYAQFLQSYGGDFYIYAPKQDPFLRKKWREQWDAEYISMLRDLVKTFHDCHIQFGVGFSPFGLGSVVSREDHAHLEKKLEIMNDLGIDMLGLFFDDMPTNENLASTQIEAFNVIKKIFKKKIIFCPSYYTPDPILDKVFGQRPVNYLEDIAHGIASDVALAWTGPKVISPVLDNPHLEETAKILQRKPFIWENIFANDGPKNCKFLKMKHFTGRESSSLDLVEGYGFNMMNQAELSKILFLSSLNTLKGDSPEVGYEKALSDLTSPAFQDFLIRENNTILNLGLDQISDEQKQSFLSFLKNCSDPAAREVEDWLLGKYLVGTECLTD